MTKEGYLQKEELILTQGSRVRAHNDGRGEVRLRAPRAGSRETRLQPQTQSLKSGLEVGKATTLKVCGHEELPLARLYLVMASQPPQTVLPSIQVPEPRWYIFHTFHSTVARVDLELLILLLHL